MNNQRRNVKQRPYPTRWRRGWLLGVAALAATATLASIPLQETLRSPFTHFDGSAISDRPDSPVRHSVTDKDAAPGGDVSRAGVWSDIAISRGDTFTNLMHRAGFEVGDLIATLRTDERTRPLTQLNPEYHLRVRADSSNRILEIIYPVNVNESLRILRQGPGFVVRTVQHKLETRLAHVGVTIHTTLFEDGHDAGLTDVLILKLVEIFGWDIDFALDIRPGDRFSLVHEEKYWLGQRVADGVILAAEFTSRGRTHRAYAFRNASGITQYYEDNGLSKRRDFLRTPIEFSRVSSGFSLGRLHPILKRWTAHKGVDYAAPAGTPVRASSSGRVLAIGSDGGYGKRIILRHDATHNTLYAHLSRFQSNLRVGSYVDQGQVIGFVGSTGLSTGPHLHYEFLVNGEHRNPLAVRFSGATPIAPEYRDTFLADTRKLATRLDLMTRTAVAANTR
jgi:murein DD-endopeptidase MepM/ murein hydrolase activator NlpD